jgi:MFS family permease
MRNYAQFIRDNRRLLAFGMFMTFFSSFGQTFLISLFVPSFDKGLGLSAAEFGGLYSLATLCSAGALPFVGRWIDDVPVRRYALGVAIGVGLGCLAMSAIQTWWQLFACLLLLRLSGQGLCGHTASTTMARNFSVNRGKALSVSSTGFAIGEGALPAIVVTLIAAVGWRSVWTIQAACVALILVPAIIALLRHSDVDNHPRQSKAGDASDAAEKEWTRGHVLRDPRFYLLLPSILVLPIAVTGLIIHQASLAEFKGWTLETMAFGFVGFAIARILSSLAIGPAIDRYGAARIFPFLTLPMALGMGVLLISDHVIAAGIYLALTGLCLGMKGSATSSLWAELYGVRHLGAIKSLGGSLAVFGTSLSPASFGWLLDRGLGFPALLVGNIALIAIACVMSWLVCRKLERGHP